MAHDRSGYHRHHNRDRPSLDDISLNELLPADSVAVTSLSTSPVPSSRPSGLGSALESGRGSGSGPISPLEPPAEVQVELEAETRQGTEAAGVQIPIQIQQGDLYSFTQSRNTSILAITALLSFLSPLSTQIHYPLLPALLHSYSYSLSSGQINLSITTYMIIQGLIPIFLDPLCEKCGRRPVYLLFLLVYTLANVGLAMQTTYPALLTLRALQAAGISGVGGLGYAAVSDLYPAVQRDRYRYIGIMGAGCMGVSAIAPVLGGVITEFAGWRYVFWVLAGIGGGLLLVVWGVLPETKRDIAGGGRSINLVEWWGVYGVGLFKKTPTVAVDSGSDPGSDIGGDAGENDPGRQDVLVSTIVNGHGHDQRNDNSPINLPPATPAEHPKSIKTLPHLLINPTALILLSSLGLLMFSHIALLTSTPSLFAEIYGLNSLQVGLCFLPVGIGSSLGALMNGHNLNWNYRRHARGLELREAPSSFLSEVPTTTPTPTPTPTPTTATATATAAIEAEQRALEAARAQIPVTKARLQPLIPFLLVTIAVTVAYGFTLQERAHLAVPLTLHFLHGFGLSFCTDTLNTLLADLSPVHLSPDPVTESEFLTTTAVNLSASWTGALGAAAIGPMVGSMQINWAFVFLGCLGAVSGVGVCVLYVDVFGERGKGKGRLRLRARARMGLGLGLGLESRERDRDGVGVGDGDGDEIQVEVERERESGDLYEA